MVRLLERRVLHVKGGAKSAPLFIFWMILPVILIISVFTFYPTVNGIILAFENYSVFNFSNIHLVGLKNFNKILSDPLFWIALWNTLWWIVLSVVFQFVLGFGLALLMRDPFKGRGIYAGLVFYPWALSGFAIGILWSWLLNGQFGFINDILMKLHIISQGINFLSDPSWAFFSVIMVNIWYGIPFFAIKLLAALQSIPEELYESAQIDGAGVFSRFFHVTLPYVSSTVFATLLLRVIWVMNFPDVIYGMTRGGPGGTTNILATYMINIVYYKNDYSLASAVGVFIITILMIYSVFYLQFTSKHGAGEF